MRISIKDLDDSDRVHTLTWETRHDSDNEGGTSGVIGS